jgi:hypothetical protein
LRFLLGSARLRLWTSSSSSVSEHEVEKTIRHGKSIVYYYALP